MTALLGIVAVLIAALGVLYGYAAHCGPWDGLYFAVVTVTTVGYGDLVPHGWAPHLTALAIMVLIIPLWTGVFSLLTSGFIADHIDKRHGEQAARTGQIGARLDLLLRTAIPVGPKTAAPGGPSGDLPVTARRTRAPKAKTPPAGPGKPEGQA